MSDAENDPSAGFVRFKGKGQRGYPLVPYDLEISVCQRDGTWIPLRGVCRAKFEIRPDEMVTAEMVVEVGELDLEAIPIAYLVRRTWRHCLIWWLRRRWRRLVK